MGPGTIKNALDQLIPPRSKRVLMTARTIPYTLAPGVLLFLMACLARTSKTKSLRLAFLPVVVLSCIHVAFGYAWEEESMHMSNAAFISLSMIAKALDMALPSGGALRVHECDSAPKHEGGAAQAELPPVLSRAWFTDVLSLLLSARGIGWEFGRGTPIPAPTRPSTRLGFLLAIAASILIELFILDITNSFIHLLPGLNSLKGGTIFYADLPPLQRYTVSLYITLLTGICGAAVINLLYDIIAFSAVGLLQQDPRSWPPVMHCPWAAHSLRDFWARWHQFARHTLLVFGGILGKYTGGRAGRVLDAFIVSGLFHECAMYPLNDTWDWRQLAVFQAMGILVVAEAAWTYVTGKRVGGLWGRIWTWTVLALLMPSLVDSWYLKGIGGAGRDMQQVSPTTRYVIPLVQRSILNWNLTSV